MDAQLRAFIKIQEPLIQQLLEKVARVQGVLKAGQQLSFRIEVQSAPLVVVGKRKKRTVSERDITAQEWDTVLGMRWNESDRGILRSLRQARDREVHSEVLAKTLGRERFFSTDLSRINYKLGKLKPPLRIVTTKRGRGTEDSFWKLAEIS